MTAVYICKEMMYYVHVYGKSCIVHVYSPHVWYIQL